VWVKKNEGLISGTTGGGTGIQVKRVEGARDGFKIRFSRKGPKSSPPGPKQGKGGGGVQKGMVSTGRMSWLGKTQKPRDPTKTNQGLKENARLDGILNWGMLQKAQRTARQNNLEK